jgi:hypothetical protein
VAELARLQSGNTRHAAVTVQADDLRKMLDAMVAVDVNDPAVMVRARMLLAQLVDLRPSRDCDHAFTRRGSLVQSLYRPPK